MAAERKRKTDMFGKYKNTLLAAVSLIALASCARIHEDLPRCEIYLEFIFDHNMEYANSFNPQVNAVNVFVFDGSDRFLFTKRAAREELTDGRIMPLADDLEAGRYKVLTVGGLSDKFRICDLLGEDIKKGETTLADIQLVLTRGSSVVSHQFPHLWFGKVVDIDYSPGVTAHKVWPVHLVRNTNRFNFMLVRLDPVNRTRASSAAPYTFEIITPEGAAYSWDNEPVSMDDPVTYKPYSLGPGPDPENLAVAHLNTCRLFKRDNYGYRLIVRNTSTFKEAWNYDLMPLLENSKPETRPDGTALPLQEYLDRQGEWNIAILHRGGGEDEIHDAFIAIQVRVNGWIVWQSDIEI